jgi:hypothetical protein
MREAMMREALVPVTVGHAEGGEGEGGDDEGGDDEGGDDEGGDDEGGDDEGGDDEGGDDEDENNNGDIEDVGAKNLDKNFQKKLLTEFPNTRNKQMEEIIEKPTLDTDEQNTFESTTIVDPTQETLPYIGYIQPIKEIPPIVDPDTEIVPPIVDPDTEIVPPIVDPVNEQNCNSNEIELNGNCIKRDEALKKIKDSDNLDFTFTEYEEKEFNNYLVKSQLTEEEYNRVKDLAVKQNLQIEVKSLNFKPACSKCAYMLNGMDTSNRKLYVLTSLRNDSQNLNSVNQGEEDINKDSKLGIRDKKSSIPVPSINNEKPVSTLENDPLQILNYRLAIGEITIDEYNKIKDILLSQSNLTPNPNN